MWSLLQKVENDHICYKHEASLKSPVSLMLHGDKVDLTSYHTVCLARRILHMETKNVILFH